MANIGDMIGGKYEILRQLQSGGMSHVYVAMKKNLNKTWCVKEIIKNPNDDKINIKINQALTEVKIMSKLKHDFLPSIVDVYDEEHALYIVMDYIEGDNLKVVMSNNGAQAQEDVIKWAKQLTSVLIYLHSQEPPIIYRDMKPNNIMLKPDGNIKLIDFGISKEYKEEATKDTHMFVTDGYGAPEQCAGGKTDERSDIYSLGITLFYLLTNVDPQVHAYIGTPIREINPSLSGGLESIILKCTRRNPDERYQSAAELMYSLENYYKEDIEYKKMQLTKLKRFLISCSLSLCSFFIAFCCFIGINKRNKNDYSRLIALADSSVSVTDKQSYYIDAIHVIPGDINAYISLIETFKIDDFTINEEEEFKVLLNEYLSILQEQDDYGLLAYEIGKLYWYYYDYGNSTDNMTKAMSSLKWFKDAAQYGENEDYYSMASSYKQIGEFYVTITQKVEEASDKDMYIDLFVSLQTLYECMNSSNDLQEIVELESSKLILNSLSAYARKMKNDGVLQQDMELLFNSVLSYFYQIETTTDKTNNFKQEILINIPSYKESIKNAYININIEVNDVQPNLK